ncbi:hypothetical protein AZL_c04230 (plasmid) [Azospirillum sp. B510]|uniref:hypothetical protein n=1 Tax=Azospirillum sp. (strain B510) TaxID=137722 RepID=UPI0001C4C96A|nr:hypothetical protein [Azospirillum sp. B510]BAI75716.1 hypothetical protein AZL_c04230 [Azospirillum sp. B510]
MPNSDMTGTGGPTPTGSTPGSSVSGGHDSADDLKKTAERAAGDVMSAGRETLGDAQGRIRSLLEHQTGRAAGQLDGVANALHKAAEQLTRENGGVVADYAEQAAGRVERVADMLRDATVDDIVGEVESVARRQPELFIGAAFAIGFLAARFIKSSGERRLHRAPTSRHGTAHPAQSVRSTRGVTAGLTGGIAEPVSRSTPPRSADTPATGSSGPLTAPPTDRKDPERGSDRPGEPKPAAGRIGMPLSSAPAPVTGRGSPTSADTALGTSTAGSAGSGVNAGTTSVPQPQGPRP